MKIPPRDTDFTRSGVIAGGYKITVRVITSVYKGKDEIDFDHWLIGMRIMTN